MLDFEVPAIAALIEERGWASLPQADRIGAIYDFVRDDIPFGYNRADDISASSVLRDGYGQCNTKATLLMALLREVGVSCRLHGFMIHKALQRGVVPEAVYPWAPAEIFHSWVEVELNDNWLNLEGFILDSLYLRVIQAAFPDRDSLCGYGVGTDRLDAPWVGWTSEDTYIQKTGIAGDLGTFASPDDFFKNREQAIGRLKKRLYRHGMNARVRKIRNGSAPPRPGLGPGRKGLPKEHGHAA
ncbi:transglutaminase-like domain-containing protein [Limimaricola cinnabarinus]|uniref:transglutaminase-like domain-containing protein n=1 Tax=Limimaricola cinnabarinus TaxID=1125964 RepID=UPI002FE0BB58